MLVLCLKLLLAGKLLGCLACSSLLELKGDKMVPRHEHLWPDMVHEGTVRRMWPRRDSYCATSVAPSLWLLCDHARHAPPCQQLQHLIHRLSVAGDKVMRHGLPEAARCS